MTILSTRETEVVLLLGCYRYLRRNQIEEFLFDQTEISESSRNTTSWRVLRSLTRRGLVDRTSHVVGGPGGGSARLGYFLTTDGYRLAQSLNPNLPPKGRSSGGTFLLQHAVMTAEVALAFRRSARSHPNHDLIDWECDWQAAQRVGSSVVVPDGHVVYAATECELDALIEVDLGTEGTRFFGRKIARYLDLYRSGNWQRHLPAWPVVLTVTKDAPRAAALKRATEALLQSRPDARQLQAGTEFAFASLKDVVEQGPLGTIWHVVGQVGPRALISEAHSNGRGLD